MQSFCLNFSAQSETTNTFVVTVTSTLLQVNRCNHSESPSQQQDNNIHLPLTPLATMKLLMKVKIKKMRSFP